MLNMANAYEIKALNTNDLDAQHRLKHVTLIKFDPYAHALQNAIEGNQKLKAKNRDEARDKAALIKFYSERHYKPLWHEKGLKTGKAQSMIKHLQAADQEGLNPKDYALKEKREKNDSTSHEIALSMKALKYIRHAYSGRIHPHTIRAMRDLKRHLPDPVKALNKLSQSTNPAKILHSYHPTHSQYQKLRQKLAELRHQEKNTEPQIVIPSGRFLKIGRKDKRNILLRKRLNIYHSKEIKPEIFDEALKEAVIQFQKANDLKPDGIVGHATLSKLNGPARPSQSDIIVNMEQWRLMPRDLGEFHVFVNIPEFRVWIKEKDQTRHTTRVVVGKVKNQTPIFSDVMEHLVVNPFWNVPASIATKEMLPRIKSDPGYLTRANYEVVARIKGRHRVVDPHSIDWQNLSLRNMPRIRQKPGRRNALGTIKFMFPNKHAVYLHDTPSKSLFKKGYRAFSHGCVRVQNPIAFADSLLKFEQKWNGERIKQMIGKKARTLILKRKIPVHLAYFTARINDNNKLVKAGDVYGHHRTLKKHLGLL